MSKPANCWVTDRTEAMDARLRRWTSRAEVKDRNAQPPVDMFTLLRNSSGWSARLNAFGHVL